MIYLYFVKQDAVFKILKEWRLHGFLKGVCILLYCTVWGSWYKERTILKVASNVASVWMIVLVVPYSYLVDPREYQDQECATILYYIIVQHTPFQYIDTKILYLIVVKFT